MTYRNRYALRRQKQKSQNYVVKIQTKTVIIASNYRIFTTPEFEESSKNLIAFACSPTPNPEGSWNAAKPSSQPAWRLAKSLSNVKPEAFIDRSRASRMWSSLVLIIILSDSLCRALVEKYADCNKVGLQRVERVRT
ncbi:hypothetical protein MSG28_011485 [Choristoneura fumiferana]|uniref:Uncharacterized protein n=1 Tax=Choristoneura fumiferana TaxID=7141 RepID=A0ACC0JNJ7_CHOFU|nr:hypothetical protein MSG28_011485 [Choristoneura fumiferana]